MVRGGMVVNLYVDEYSYPQPFDAFTLQQQVVLYSSFPSGILYEVLDVCVFIMYEEKEEFVDT